MAVLAEGMVVLLMLDMGTIHTCNVGVGGSVGRVGGEDAGIMVMLVGVVDSFGLSNVAGSGGGHTRTGTGTVIGDADRRQERAWVHVAVLGAGGTIEVLVLLVLVLIIGCCGGGGISVVVGGVRVALTSNHVDQVAGLVFEGFHRGGLVDSGVGGGGVVGRVGHVENACCVEIGLDELKMEKRERHGLYIHTKKGL